MEIISREMLRACGISESDAVLAAISGGADSTALLVGLCERRKSGAVGTVYAAHLHHGIRGAAADADAAFCESLCAKYGVPLTIAHADAPAYAKESGQSLETAARELRYAFLRKEMHAQKASCIMTAHHRDDQAETVLMHLIRGCGLQGLCGMRARAGDIARPMLSLGRREIEAFLTERGIAWQHDQTNDDPSATRNRIRLSVLPLLDTFRPDAACAIANTARRLSEDEAYLSDLAEREAAQIFANGGYQRTALYALPAPLKKRILRKLLLDSAHDVTETDIDRVETLLTAQTGTRIELSGGRSAWVDSERLYVGTYPARQRYQVPFVPLGETRLPCGSVFAEETDHWQKPENAYEQFLDLDALPENAVVRTRRDGDRFHPLGMQGSRKLSDVLTDKKIPLTARDMPLLAAGNEIYCVFGLTISALAAITPDTRHILHIVLKGDFEV